MGQDTASANQLRLNTVIMPPIKTINAKDMHPIKSTKAADHKSIFQQLL